MTKAPHCGAFGLCVPGRVFSKHANGRWHRSPITTRNQRATHDVKLEFPEFNLGKSDVAFSIRKDDELLGELRISHGTPVWFPANASHGYKLSWSKLGALFEEHGTSKAEKR